MSANLTKPSMVSNRHLELGTTSSRTFCDHGVRQISNTLAQRFSIKDLGHLNYFLGVEVYLIKGRAERAHGSIEAYIFALDTFTVRVEACEQGHDDSTTLTTLKADIVGMRKDVDELKSTDLSMLFGIVEILDIPSTDVPPSSEIPPATTIGDVAMETVDAEFEIETDEEELGVREEAVYNDLADL
uniref:Polyprotein protein, identical n=1 Tax=Solanum tuberosum TaxID=4113 RepID=Q60CY1_SOLTU|nr:polyprotein protein, identical [Solanum tuberosum]